jgi:hypothetical protein
VTPEQLNQYGANIPPDFKFENGDSINIKIICRIGSYYTTGILLIRMTYRAFFIDRSHIIPDPFSCMASKDSISLATQGISFNQNQDTLFICKSAFELFKGVIKGTKPLENYFTNEFRDHYSLDSIKIQAPAALIIDSILLEYRYEHDTSSVLIKSQYYPAQWINNRWQIDPSLLKLNHFDESYSLRITPYAHLKDCNRFNDSVRIVIVSYYINGNEGTVFYDINSPNKIVNNQLYSRAHQVWLFNGNDHLSIPSKIIYNASGNIDWTFLVSNLKVPGAFEFEIQSKKSNIENIRIQSSADVQILKRDSSHFRISNLSPKKNYQIAINGEHSYCETDTILIFSKWICENDSSILDDHCNVDTFQVIVKTYKPQLELGLKQEAKESVLCDTLPEINIEIFNADDGGACNVYLDVFIPQGTTIIFSESSYSYLDSINKILPPPEALGSNRYRWNFSDFISAIQQNCLLRYDTMLDNSIKLKITLITSCNAAVNGYPSFSVFGANHCGIPINSVEKNGKPIRIKGLSAPGDFDLFMQNPDAKICTDESTLRISIIKNSGSILNDSLKLILPEGIHYKLKSLTNIRNMPVMEPQIQNQFNQEYLCFALDPNLKENDSTVFTISIFGLKSILCSDGMVMAFTFSKAKTFCDATKDSCDALITSGSTEMMIQQKTGSFSLDSFRIIKSTDSVNYKLQFKYILNNKSLIPDTILCVHLFEDLNFNKRLDSTDHLIITQFINIRQILNDGIYLFESSLNRSVINTCNYILSTCPEQCICTLDTLAYSLQSFKAFTQRDSLCAGSGIPVGIKQDPLKKYLWISGDVVCDTCSINMIITNANIQKDTLLNYTLIERDTLGCNVEYNFLLKSLHHF